MAKDTRSRAVKEAEKNLPPIPDELQPERKRKNIVAWLIPPLIKQRAEAYVTPSGQRGIEKTSRPNSRAHYIWLTRERYDRVRGKSVFDKQPIGVKLPCRTDDNEATAQGYSEAEVREAFANHRKSQEGRLYGQIRELTQEDIDMMERGKLIASQDDIAIAEARKASAEKVNIAGGSSSGNSLDAELGLLDEGVPLEALAMAGLAE